MKERKLHSNFYWILFAITALLLSIMVTVRPALGGAEVAPEAAAAALLNADPVFTTVPSDQITTVGEHVNISVFANDTDNDTLTFSQEGVWPAGVSVVPSTGQIIGTTSALFTQATVTLKVEDGNGGEATTTFDWTVIFGTQVGNDNDVQAAERVDGSIKNMVINMSESFTNYGNSTITVYFTQFDFRALNPNVPITPFVVKVNAGTEIADGEYTVVAVGSTRDNYGVGNIFFDFANSVKTVQLAPGETLLPGFMDASPDGNNAVNGDGKGGVVALADTGDQVWYSFSSNNENQGFTVQEGSAPSPVVYGTNDPVVRTDLLRSYAFNITFGTEAAPADPPPTPTPEPTPVAPYQLVNGSFEKGSSGFDKEKIFDWGVIEIGERGVDIVEGLSTDGDRSLDLNGSQITQTVDSLVPNQPYVLMIDYHGNIDYDPENDLPTVNIGTGEGEGIGDTADAYILIDGVPQKMGIYTDSANSIPGIHTGESRDWVVCHGFEFVPTTDTVTFTIASAEPSNKANGLLIDNVRIVEGTLPEPPEHAFADLVEELGGWRALVNGDFETSPNPSSMDPENTGPDDNPHLCGDALPGWRVTRESVDLVSNVGDLSTPLSSLGDKWMLDLGGEGPGGVAQTITGLTPNTTYVVRVDAARHFEYGTEDMTSEVWVNGALAHTVVRSIDQNYRDHGYILELIEMMSNADGEITFEIFSTNETASGNIVFDNFAIIEKDAFPTLTPPNDQFDNVGDEVVLELLAEDNDDLAYSAEGLPPGLMINETTGVISGTLTTAGTYTVTVEADDNSGIPAEATFNWFVNNAPVLTSIADQVNVEGDSVEIDVMATDADNDTLEYSASNLPAGVMIITDTGKITGTLTSGGFFTVSVSVDDGNGGLVSTEFTWDINDIPELQTPTTENSNLGDEVSLQMVVTDLYKNDFTFEAVNLPTGLSIDASTGLISGTVTEAGTFNVTVSVEDEAGASDSVDFSWIINSPPSVTDPGAQAATTDDAVSLQIQATDSDGDTLVYSATDLPAGLSIDAGTGEITGTPTAAGEFTSTITVNDGNTQVSIEVVWTITQIDPPAEVNFIFLPVVR